MRAIGQLPTAYRCGGLQQAGDAKNIPPRLAEGRGLLLLKLMKSVLDKIFSVLLKAKKTGDELEELTESFERMRISTKAIRNKLERGELG